MILLVRRKRILGAAALLLSVVTALALTARPPDTIQAFSYTEPPTGHVVILDAGHGGSDGGAVSADGTPEAGINLAIVLHLRDFFALMGQQTVLTRTGEGSLADADSTTLRQEKVSDTKTGWNSSTALQMAGLSAFTRIPCLGIPAYMVPRYSTESFLTATSARYLCSRH